MKRRRLRQLCHILAISAALIAFPISVSAATGVNVDVHTPDEIRAYVSQNGDLSGAVQYEIAPDTSSDKTTYEMGDQGKLSEETRIHALKMLQNIRYVAGLSTEITLDDSLNSRAQAGAYVDYANQELTHYPSRLDGMDEELFDLGYLGTTSANIAKGHANLTAAMLDWMNDEDATNVSKLGHRRWQLNPSLSKIGLGACDVYYVNCCHDKSGSGNETGVIWPALNMPVDYFGKDIPWSISTGTNITSAKVVLTRVKDNKTWVFDTISSTAKGSGFFFEYQ